MSVHPTVYQLLQQMQDYNASDLYLTWNAPPMLRVAGKLHPGSELLLTDAAIGEYVQALVPPEKIEEFIAALELNVSYTFNETLRFRVNLYKQQGHDAIVVRRIQLHIPSIAELELPQAYADAALAKRGLVLIVGATGSGKSTSLAAMVGHRNQYGNGHIMTVEDPVEFIHSHQNCIVSQRDVGLDTYSYAAALKNVLRQQPDMVVIGEVRDREVMEQAIYFAETSHLCIATIHAKNSSQVIERILNFFPEERHPQLLMNLALNLHGVFSQRLVDNVDGQKSLALEVMLNRGAIRQQIIRGKIPELRELIERGASDGMMAFDQSLFELFKRGRITEEVAIAEADSQANLRLLLNGYKRIHSVNVPISTQFKSDNF